MGVASEMGVARVGDGSPVPCSCPIVSLPVTSSVLSPVLCSGVRSADDEGVWSPFRTESRPLTLAWPLEFDPAKMTNGMRLVMNTFYCTYTMYMEFVRRII